MKTRECPSLRNAASLITVKDKCFRTVPAKPFRLLIVVSVCVSLWVSGSVPRTVCSQSAQSRVLLAHVEFRIDNRIQVGDMVLVEVVDSSLAAGNARGTVRITSASTNYDSGSQSLTFTESGNTLYYRWPTVGLKPGADYDVAATIQDNTGSRSDHIRVTVSPRVTETLKVLNTAEDLILPYFQLGLRFSRRFRYESAYFPYAGDLGFGWTHDFMIRLSERTDGYIALFDSNGRTSYYRSNNDGTYQSAPGDLSKLVRDPNGSFQVRFPAGTIWRFRNDLRLEFIQDPNGNRIICAYDAQGNLVSVTDGSGQQINFGHDSSARIIQAADSTGRTTNYAYDQSANLVRVTGPLGETTLYSYDGQHRLTQITFPDGLHDFYSYDGDRRLSRVASDGGAGALNLSYNSATGEQTINDALDRVTVARDNEAGLLTEFRDGLGNTTKFEYDANLGLTKAVDGLGNTWAFIPDSRGNPTSVTDPEGRKTTANYSSDFNKITSLTDPRGNQTRFEYGNTGDRSKTIYSDDSFEQNDVSDASGTRTIRRRLRDGQTITLNYNRLGLLTSKALPDGSRNTYAYDQRGNMIEASNPSGTIRFEYDILSRLTKAVYPGERTFTYEYDVMSRRARMVDPNGRVLEYVYNGAGQLARIGNPAEGVIAEYEYNLGGQPTKRRLLNGTFTEYGYDPANRLTSIVNRKPSGEVISSWTYEYDSVGNRTRKRGPEGDELYTYDKTSQLVSVRYPDGTSESYKYDDAGNRTTVTSDGSQKKYKTNSLDQYTKVDGVKHGYDLNGNLVSKKGGGGGKTTFDYDTENRLTQVRLPSGERITYAYDALGRMSSRADRNGTTQFLWDEDQILLEESAAHSTLATYTWGRTLDEALSMQRAGRNHFYLQDALSSVTELTDSAGNVAERYRYRAFGEPTSVSQVGNPFMFVGVFYDGGSAQFHMRARWYSAALGRFVQPDPIGISGGVNLYSYAFNDPVGLSDTFGLDPLHFGFDQHMQRMGEPGQRGPKPDIQMGNPGSCPTFIQASSEADTGPSRADKPDVAKEPLAARIDVPGNHALLRSDIPIFGIAGGTEFEEYRVEYGEGKNPAKWHLIASSKTPQPTNNIGLAEMLLMQGDLDIRGNLATWNTGLKEWVHLPWHPADDPTDFNGTYTIRLVVVGKNGKTVEDRVTCEVGRVIAQCLPGTAISTDKKVTMRFPQQSIQSAFRLYTIKPLTSGVPEIPKEQTLIGAVYTIREPGDRFMKPVTLRFDVGGQPASRSLDQLGIYCFNQGKREWELLPTVQTQANGLEASLYGLPEKAAYFAVFASKTNQSQSSARPVPGASILNVSTHAADEQPILVSNTFEGDNGEWSTRDREFGAAVSRDKRATTDGSYCLKITNEHFGGNFACTARSTRFRADMYSLVSFDYKIAPGVKTDVYVRVGDTWYNVGFTDDENDFRFKDVGMSRIGRIEGVVADGQWHSASFDLDRMLAQKTGRRLVEEIVMADWDVTGFMKLDFGRNPRGATVYIDNFKIRRNPQQHLIANSLTSDLQRRELVQDDFKVARPVNLLNGAFDVFSNPGANSCAMSYVPAPSPAQGAPPDYSLSLKYDVTRPGAYGGYWSQMQGASIEEFDQLSMKVKIVTGSTHFLVSLKNRAGIEIKLPAEGYLGAPEAAGWRELSIPLAAFRALQNLSSMEVFSIGFSSANNSGKGEILVDDIAFQKGLGQIAITDFEGADPGLNLLMQTNRTFTRGAAAISANLDGSRGAHINGHCLRVSYGGSIGLDLGGGDFSYAGWVTGLGGVDASNTKYLSFRIKGERGGESPNLYLDDGTKRRPIDIEQYSAITKQWRDVAIPLDAFARLGIDVTHLEELQFVFEWGPMSGTVYVDDIAFCKTPLAKND